MIAVLSPAKSLDYSPAPAGVPHTLPGFPAETQEIIRELRKHSAAEIGALMDLSEKLAALNHQRYKDWSPKYTDENAKQALLAFDGDVYKGFDFSAWKRPDYDFAQGRLRLLSGLHGVLRPLDLIQPYRLEMGTALPVKKAAGLYDFWGAKIAKRLNEDLAESGSDVLVNLASGEYFRSVDRKTLKARVVACVFKDGKAGKYKIISFFAKRARGLMADYIIRERVEKPEALKKFTGGGYSWDAASSTADSLVFLREGGAAEAP